MVAFQPHLVSRTRIFGTAMGGRWPPPTRSSCSTSTSPARTPTPRSPAPWSPTPCPLPAERVAFVARLRRRPRRARRPRPPGRPRAHPRRRHRHAARAAGARPARRASGEPGALAPGPARATAPGGAASLRTRRRFARRQWARRWLALRYVRGRAGARRALVVGGLWAVYFSSLLAVQGVQVDGADPAQRRGGPLGGRRPRRRAAGPASTSPRSARGSRPWPRVASADVTRQWPRHRPDPVQRARRRRGRRDRRAAARHGRRRRGLQGLRQAPRRAAPGPAHDRDPQRRAARGRPGDLGAARPTWPAGSTTSRSQTVDQISLVLRDGRTVAWGSAEDSDTKAKVLAVLLRQPRAEKYDVSVPGQPTTSG